MSRSSRWLRKKKARLPIGVWNVSLQGPITSGSVSAKMPSEPRITAINVRESVKRWRIGGRYADVVVNESARPKAPRPRNHDRPRLRCGSGTIFAGTLDTCSIFYRFTRSCRHSPDYSSSI